ncbi:MAG: DUF2442 domain-containing protein [Phaeodactylibacter sp.]|nr:DUF2442 domain-containing protein [Phaeodactylibacter sp.]MCB9292775.1 DUF2442 domain-containing protein [Lewinellaceae bacterium]
MGTPLFLKVAGIKSIEGYTVRLVFNNGETRIVDFLKFFSRERKFERALLEDFEKFSSMEVVNGTLTWLCLGVTIRDAKGREGFYAFNIDPRLLYEFGEEEGE